MKKIFSHNQIFITDQGFNIVYPWGIMFKFAWVLDIKYDADHATKRLAWLNIIGTTVLLAYFFHRKYYRQTSSILELLIVSGILVTAMGFISVLGLGLRNRYRIKKQGSIIR